MRKLILAVTAILLTATLACRDKKTREVGGVTDTALTPAPAPAADAGDTASGARDFSFGQRQDFAASIRQQLAGIDQEIAQLASQVKSKGGAVSDRALARVRASREAVNKDLSRIEAATEATWQETKNRVSRSVERLDEAIQGAQPK
jgi:hypothetical protein